MPHPILFRFVNASAGHLFLANGKPTEATFTGNWWISNDPGLYILMDGKNGQSQWGVVNRTCTNAVPLPQIFNVELHGCAETSAETAALSREIS